MSDRAREADEIRRQMIRSNQPEHDLAADTGPRWHGAAELARDFVVLGFAAPYVVVRRKSDGALGSLEFTDRPRIYFNWRPDE